MIAYDEDCGGERGVEGRGGTTEETGLIELNLAFGGGGVGWDPFRVRSVGMM